MCIDFDGHHSGGSSFVYVNDFCYYRNCLYTHRYKFSFEKKNSTGGSSFVYVNDFCYYRNCLYTHKYKFSFEKKNKKQVKSLCI